MAPDKDKLVDTKRKTFCDHSCAAKYNNLGVVKNPFGGLGKVNQERYAQIIDSINWSDVQKYHDNGNGRGKCLEKFDISVVIWRKALQQGILLKNVKTQLQSGKLTLEERLLVRLQKGRSYNSKSLKKDLIEAGILKEECNRCGILYWQGEKLVTQLHHKDGDTTNNLKENLELLCPNCHSITPTWGKQKSVR